MSDIVIRCEKLGKRYRIGAKREPYRTLRDTLSNAAKAPFRLLARKANEAADTGQNTIWALKDVSFEVKRGEVVGIIGRNGAGKSTLLSILSRITEPTEGRARLKGRVAALLEVGTGFNPELTGRENIYLNAAILGMKKVEIDRKFDEIVAFAEVEKFIDTPVKHFSTGMYLRLGFAVAAHLEPEILVVDEVLAVGDASFQKKCLGKMGDVAKSGRTVLFVSHHTPAINRLCPRAILLEDGRLRRDGEADKVTAMYLATGGRSSGVGSCKTGSVEPGDSTARLLQVGIRQHGRPTNSVDIRYPFDIEMKYRILEAGHSLIQGFSIFNDEGIIVFVTADFDDALYGAPRPTGMHLCHATIPGNLMAEGSYRVAVEVSTRKPAYHIHFLEYDSAFFQVVDSGEPGSVRCGWGRPIPGVVRPLVSWSNEVIEEPREEDS